MKVKKIRRFFQQDWDKNVNIEPSLPKLDRWGADKLSGT